MNRKRRLVSERLDPALIWAVMLAERILYSIWDKTYFSIANADSTGYYASGLYFARTGTICYPPEVPTALVMPGTTVGIGLLALVFPDGPALVWAIRIVWILLGSLTPVYIYKSVRLFAPRIWAILAAAAYLLPWYVEIDGFLLSECPSYLLFSIALYYGLKIGEGDSSRNAAMKYGLAVLAGTLFRANTLLLLVFMTGWWILRGRLSVREVLSRLAVAGMLLALFLVPWTIRNYRLFYNFIPVTYGSSNPVYEGTFRGEGFPTYEELEERNDGYDVNAVVRAQHPELYQDDGTLIHDYLWQYEGSLCAGVLAKYRMNLWFQLRPGSFLKSYLYLKPKWILNWVWYYVEIMGISLETACRIRQINLLLCLLGGITALCLKRFRKITLFLGITYVINLYIVASSFPIDRYAQAIMPYRIILGGISCYLLYLGFQRIIGRLRPEKRSDVFDRQAD